MENSIEIKLSKNYNPIHDDGITQYDRDTLLKKYGRDKLVDLLEDNVFEITEQRLADVKTFELDGELCYHETGINEGDWSFEELEHETMEEVWDELLQIAVDFENKMITNLEGE